MPDVHVIDVTGSGWTLMHPLSCRPRLFDCVVTQAAQWLTAALMPMPGRWVAEVDSDGVLQIGRPATAADVEADSKRAVRLATQLLTLFFSGERRGVDRMRRTGWVTDERVEGWLAELQALTGKSEQDDENMPENMTAAAEDDSPYFEAVYRVLAVEVGAVRAQYLAQRLVDERLARAREMQQEDLAEVVQVPADAVHRLGLAVTFPTGPLVRSVLDAIREWPRGRAALEPRPPRVWRLDRRVSTVTPSGLPWAGEQLQVTVHPDGVPTVLVRRPAHQVALLLPVSEVEASQ